MRARAILEVLALTALTFLVYKALKWVEPAGQNHAPGFVMILVAAAILRVHRRDPAFDGVVLPVSRQGLSLGVVFAAVVFPVWLSGVLLSARGEGTALRLALGVAAALVFFVLPRCPLAGRILRRMRPEHSLLLLAGVLVGVVLTALSFPSVSAASVGSTLTGRFFFTGFGEELFFRGYVHSRLDGAFGRPRRLLGAPVGLGLLLTALLFGGIHLLNPTQPFHGEWALAWGWGASTFASGLVFGWLRAMTGSIWAGAVAHGAASVYRGVSGLLAIA